MDDRPAEGSSPIGSLVLVVEHAVDLGLERNGAARVLEHLDVAEAGATLVRITRKYVYAYCL